MLLKWEDHIVWSVIKGVAAGVHFILNGRHAVQCDVLFDNITESRLLGLVESTKGHAWVLIKIRINVGSV